MSKSDPTTEEQVQKSTQSQNDRGQIGLVYQQNIVPGVIKQQALVPHPCQKADIYYGKDGVNFSRLPIGSTGQVLTVVGGVPVWQFLLTTGLAVNRPTSGAFIGAMYYATNTFVLSIWNGSVWKSSTFA